MTDAEMSPDYETGGVVPETRTHDQDTQGWRVYEYGLPGETDLWTEDGNTTIEMPKSLTRVLEAALAHPPATDEKVFTQEQWDALVTQRDEWMTKALSARPESAGGQ